MLAVAVVSALSYFRISAVQAAVEPLVESVCGTVLYSQAWQFFLLQTPERIVRVSTRQGEPVLEPGDAVAVSGVPARRNGRIIIEAATYEKTAENVELPPPVAISPADLPRVYAADGNEDLFGRLVRFTARAKNLVFRDWGIAEIHLDFQGREILATLTEFPQGELAEALGLEPLVDVAGFLILEDVNLPDGSLPRIELRIPDASAIAIVPDSAFKRRLFVRNAQKLLGFVPWVLAVAVAFLLVKLAHARQTRIKLQAVIAERRRMAADLHDSIEQHLAGARLYLDSILPPDGRSAPPQLKPAELARDILVAVKREIRDTIWNLRLDELSDKRPADVLRGLADRISKYNAVRVEARIGDLPEKLPEQLFSNVLYIVQEAVTNAVKHGKATRIILFADKTGADSYVLGIVNNGASFNAGRALGPETGHFGLAGMRERARQSNIAIRFKSTRRTTSARLRFAVEI